MPRRRGAGVTVVRRGAETETGPGVNDAATSRTARCLASATSREVWLGDFDYGAQCVPALPCSGKRKRAAGEFFGPGGRIPLVVALVMGLQHACTMAGSVIIVPRIIAGPGEGHLNLDAGGEAYLISMTFVACGFSTALRSAGLPLIGRYRLGAGVITFAGSSIAFIPIAEATVRAIYAEGTMCAASEPCPAAYGRWLGTLMVGSAFQVCLAFVPPRTLRAACPPLVTGPTVLLLALSLLSVAARMVAGGAGPCFLASRVTRDTQGAVPLPPALQPYSLCPVSTARRAYAWGAAPWIGLAAFVLLTLVLFEAFGCLALRNTQVISALLLGVAIAAPLGFFDVTYIRRAAVFTYPLARSFPLGLYAPALIPVFIAHVVGTVKVLADVTAMAEVARFDPPDDSDGGAMTPRWQGAILADGVASLVGALLFAAMPTTTYSENVGIVAVTRAAHPAVGYAAGGWLVLFGVFGKLGGFFGAMPDALIGGILCFLFGSVAASAVHMLAQLAWTGRDRFILALTLGVGVIATIEPDALALFVPEGSTAFTKGLSQGVVIVLRTGFSLGAIIATLLNALLPSDDEEAEEEEAGPVVPLTMSEDISEYRQRG